MSSEACRRYEEIQAHLKTDEEYLMREGIYRTREAAFQRLMAVLTEEQRGTILNYIGICAELDERAMEIACFL